MAKLSAHGSEVRRFEISETSRFRVMSDGKVLWQCRIDGRWEAPKIERRWTLARLERRAAVGALREVPVA
jgi:hypothetical protein